MLNRGMMMSSFLAFLVFIDWICSSFTDGLYVPLSFEIMCIVSGEPRIDASTLAIIVCYVSSTSST